MEALLIPAFILSLLLLAAAAGALLLYAVPISASATFVHTADRRTQVIRIAWGPVAIRTTGTGPGMVTGVLVLDRPLITHTGRLEAPAPEPADTVPAPQPEPSHGTGLDTGELVHIVHRLIGPVGKFGSAFWRASRFVDARGTVRLGLGDPALTGELSGYYWAFRFLLIASRIYVELEPVFDRPVLEFDVTVRTEVPHPIVVMAAGLDLARDPAVADLLGRLQRKPAGAAAA